MKQIFKNAVMLYGLNIAKIVFPLLTLPYLTRVLSVNSYGMVSYVKAIMQYVQITIDFGFMLSGTREIVMHRKNPGEINKIVTKIVLGSLILSLLSLIAVVIVMYNSKVLAHGYFFTILSFFNVVLSIFLVDFYFRGIEKMEVITVRFLIMKVISLIATLIFVKGDSTLILMPLFDIIGSLWAAGFVFTRLKNDGVRFVRVKIIEVFKELKESFIYFSSNIATTAFNGLNTVVIGFVLSSTEVAFWGICLQIVVAIQGLYSPISDAIYPHMVQTKNIQIIKKFLYLLGPIVLIGCCVVFFLSGTILRVISGYKYVSAGYLLQSLTPVLFFGFISILMGWPTLGAIGKQRQTTLSTIIAAAFQTLGIILLLLFNAFSLPNVALLRILTEFLLAAIRVFFTVKYRKEFTNVPVKLWIFRR